MKSTALIITAVCISASAICEFLDVSLKTKTVPNVVFQDEPPPRLLLKNTSGSSLSGTFTFSIPGYVEESSVSLQLKKNEKHEKNLPEIPDYGLFEVQYTFTSVGKPERSSVKFVRTLTSESKMDNPHINIGIAPHHHGRKWSEKIAFISEIGASTGRFNLNWRAVEVKPGKYVLEKFEKRVDALLAGGVRPQALVTACPQWAATEERRNAGKHYKNWGLWPPEDMDNWRKFIRVIAECFNDKIYHWEIWNEADWGFYRGTVDEYIELVKIAREELKAVNPENMILSSGFAVADPYSGSAGPKDFQAQVLQKAGHLFDFHAMHQHGTFDVLVDAVDNKLIPCREKFNVKAPLYFNETSVGMHVPEDKRAETVIKKALFCFSRGSRFYDYFTYSGAGSYSLLNSKTAKPTDKIPALGNLIKLIQGKRFVKQYPLGEKQWALLFTDKNETVLAYWNHDPMKDGPGILAQIPEKDWTVCDIYGNTIDSGKTEYTALSFSNSPKYLVLPIANANINLQGTLVEQSKPVIIFDDQKVETDVVISNPFSNPLQISMEWIRDHTQLETEQYTITAGDQISVKKSFRAGTPVPPALTVNWHAEEPSLKGKIEIPLLPCGKVVKSEKPKEPTFILNKRSQIINLREADPLFSSTYWKGPNDLSANIWLYTRNRELVIDMEIKDDIRLKRNEGKHLYNGESTQVCIDLNSQNGTWVFAFGRESSGKPVVQRNKTPGSMSVDLSKISYREKRVDSNHVLASASIPFDVIGMTEEDARNGFRFNLLLNDDDNDGHGRVGYIRVADGFGGKLIAEMFPIIVIRK